MAHASFQVRRVRWVHRRTAVMYVRWRELRWRRTVQVRPGLDKRVRRPREFAEEGRGQDWMMHRMRTRPLLLVPSYRRVYRYRVNKDGSR